MNYKKRVEWYTKEVDLCQALSSGLEFAFVSKNKVQCCPFVLCKDFLQDAIYNQLYGTKKEIYEFCYNPAVDAPIGLDKIRLLLANSRDPKFKTKIPICLDFINQIEKKLHIAKTTVKECAKPPKQYKRGGVFWFEGSNRWLRSPVMLSLYTLLLRVGFCHQIGDDPLVTINNVAAGKVKSYQEGDRKKLNDSLAGILNIMKHKDLKIFHNDMKKNYPKTVCISIMHNNMGIAGYSSKGTKQWVPHWHRPEVS